MLITNSTQSLPIFASCMHPSLDTHPRCKVHLINTFSWLNHNKECIANNNSTLEFSSPYTHQPVRNICIPFDVRVCSVGQAFDAKGYCCKPPSKIQHPKNQEKETASYQKSKRLLIETISSTVACTQSYCSSHVHQLEQDLFHAPKES